MEATLRPEVKNHTNGAGGDHAGRELTARELLAPQDDFVRRHIGPTPQDVAKMLQTIGVRTLDELIDATVPPSIRVRRPLQMALHR